MSEEVTATAAAPADKAPVGKTLGRYRLERELGEGGMGVVHAAFDPDLERRVALKVLRGDSGNDEARQRLLREARAMARLTHANVVTVHEVGSASGRDYVAMELIDGGSLAEWLRGEKRGEGEILDAFRAAGRGLAAAHAAGLVHRDFKPHNVLRRRADGRICVTDFGLARGVDTPASGLEATMDAAKPELTPSSLSGLTATGAVMGTPAYMAPEQWAGGQIGPAADQFAFCVALWEALTGERPFKGTTMDDLKAEASRGAAALDATKLPKELRAPLVRGLDPDPAKRWPSMNDLLAAIAPPAAPPARRSLAPWFAGGAVVAAAALYVAIGRGDEAAVAPGGGCDLGEAAIAAAWPAGAGSAFAASGREELRDAIERDLASWRDARKAVCALSSERRAAGLACLDGALARLDAIRQAAASLNGALDASDFVAVAFAPASCSREVPPRLTVTTSADTVAALALVLDSGRANRDHAIADGAALAAKPGLEPCARAFALRAQVQYLLDGDHTRGAALAREEVLAADACADERVRAEAAIDEAPFEFGANEAGAKGRAALEHARIAVERVAQPDLDAQLDILVGYVAGQDRRWQDGFAAYDRAIAAYTSRKALRAQIRTIDAETMLRFQRNEPGDLDAVRAAMAKWLPVAEEHHWQRAIEGMVVSDAYARLFLGDVAGAQPGLMRAVARMPHGPGPFQAIDGMVVDAAGKPVAGATIGAAQQLIVDAAGPVPLGHLGPGSLRVVTSDADGHFSIPDGPMTGQIGAKLGERFAAATIAPHVKLVLGPTRTISGKVRLGNVPPYQVFVMVAPYVGADYIAMSPVQADGSFVVAAAPTAEVHVGAMHWDMAQTGTIQFKRVAAGSADVQGVEIEPAHSGRTLAVVVRSAVATPLDAAEIIALPGRPVLRTLADLDKISDRSSVQVQFPHALVGEAVPKAAVGRARAGDLVGELENVQPGDVTICVVGLQGDLQDAAVQRQIDAHRKDLAFHCEVASGTDRAIVVEAPPQKRFD